MDSPAVAPLSLIRGRIIEPYEGLNTYRIHLERGGLAIATYEGGTRGPIGANESGGFQAGQTVWVGVDLTNSSQNTRATIFGACAQTNRDWSVDEYPSLSVGIPDQVGYLYGKRVAGQLRSQQLSQGAVFCAEDVGVADALPGDWMMTNSQGAGVGVEGWRSWLRAGPLCGVTCWSDEQLIRVEGMTAQYRTFLCEAEDGIEGPAAMRTSRRHHYPVEALNDSAPRTLEVAGPLHAGAHTHELSRDDLSGTGQAGLLHEHRGIDGSYVLRSATAIHLVRTVAIRVPAEVIPESSLETPIDLPDPTLPTPSDVANKLADPRPYLEANTAEVNRAQLGPLTWFEQLLNTVWKSYQGFERTARWEFGAPAQLPVQDSAPLSTAAAGVVTLPRGMWAAPVLYRIPYDIKLPDPKVASGTSAISLMPDGSIILRDRWGSQIAMTGGNVVISAANDVVLQPGRNLNAIAGQHAVIRANDSIELEANEGRVSIKAETQLGLVGGNGHEGGVLIDNRNPAVGFRAGDGEEQVHQGLVLLSRGSLTAISAKMRLEATTDTVDDTSTGVGPGADAGEIDLVGGRVTIASRYSAMALGDDLVVRVADKETPNGSASLQMTAQAITLPYTYMAGICSQTAPTDQHIQKAIDATSLLLSEQDRLAAAQQGLIGRNFAQMGFTWPTSAQYNTQTNDQFALFEQPWQRVYQVPSAPVPTRWRQSILVTNDKPSCAYPGFETWFRGATVTGGSIPVTVPGPFVTMGLTDWWDPLTDSYSPALRDKDGPVDDQTYKLPATEGTSLDLNYIIRPS